MGKKGVLLDNGKTAQSSMALYWKASHNRAQTNKAEKKDVPEEDIESRAESNLDKWKLHKEKMINKLYDKLQKKEKTDDQAERERFKREEEQLQKNLLEKQMNKNRPVSIPGFKNASQLKSKMQFEQVKLGSNDNNKLIPRSPAEELTHEEIVQILREKKAKKQMERAQRQKIDSHLKKREVHADIMMEGIPQDKEHFLEPLKEQTPQKAPEEIPKPPENFFKSEILQKIQKGQSLRPAQEKLVEDKIIKSEDKKQENPPQANQFTSRFVPRALWQK